MMVKYLTYFAVTPERFIITKASRFGMSHNAHFTPDALSHEKLSL